MSRKFTRQETIDSALGVAFKISDAVGIDSKRIHDSIRKKSSKNDVELGNKQAQKEAEEILKNAVEKKTRDEDVEAPSLNNDHVMEILNYINKVKKDEETKKKKETTGCVLFIHLLFGVPLAALFIYIGHIHINDCTVITSLPNWLIILGVLGGIRCVLTCLSWICWKAGSSGGAGAVDAIDKLVQTANLIWTIYGCCLIWGHWSDYTYNDFASSKYCAHSVMLISKIVIAIFVICWIVLWSMLLFGGCFVLCVWWWLKEDDSDYFEQ